MAITSALYQKKWGLTRPFGLTKPHIIGYMIGVAPIIVLFHFAYYLHQSLEVGRLHVAYVSYAEGVGL